MYFAGLINLISLIWAADPGTPGGPTLVHLVTHSHDDVGWISTVEAYFFQKTFYNGCVDLIITTMIMGLEDNPNRTFTQTEIKFFKMWWDLQTPSKKQSVKKLVRNGQLEFVNGGWSSHDEACPTYDMMITNILAGHRFLAEEFGEDVAAGVKIAWQLDPFGHSNTNAKLYSDMGYEALFFARIDSYE